MHQHNQASRMRRGLVVLIGLAVLTAIEYWLAIALQVGVLPYLTVIALAKTGLIAEYFMHFSQLWHAEE